MPARRIRPSAPPLTAAVPTGAAGVVGSIWQQPGEPDEAESETVVAAYDGIKLHAGLGFQPRIDTAETGATTAYDTLRVRVPNSSGTVLSTLAVS
jgi:hypothetical protein